MDETLRDYYYSEGSGAGDITNYGWHPCPGSNGATHEQQAVVGEVGFIVGDILQNVFVVSGMLGRFMN